MTRSATTELVAAVIVMARVWPRRSLGFVRIMYGRTISPSRNGKSWMGANPPQETARSRGLGTSAIDRRRNRQRTLRNQVIVAKGTK